MDLITSTARLERLRTLTEVSRALTYATSIEDVLDLTVQRAAQLMGADKALIMLTDSDGLLTVRAAHGIDPDRVGELREPLTETLIRRLQGLLDYPMPECFLSVPLVVQGQVTGLLAAVRPLAGGDAEDDEWLLSALADQAAVALENARLADAVRAERERTARITEGNDRNQATLSHELRSPLSAIQAYSSLLLDGAYGPLTDRQRESIARVLMSGEHLLAVIENVLDAARLAAGTLRMAPTRLPVAPVLDEALDMVRPRVAQKQQELIVRTLEEVVIEGGASQVRQALVNLLGNACKYTPVGGRIEVTVGRADRDGRPVAAIAIADNGRGIPDHVLPSIFEPYNRAGALPNEPGLGLGLYICRELVRKMEGDIRVTTAPGAGSTFTVLLPLARGEAGGTGH
jgi:phosphoserine phosphatase RsbU/P